MGTAMSIKFAPPYGNLSIGFLEEATLFPIKPVKRHIFLKIIVT